MMAGNGELPVPPGFRFHPTDEELLHYYLRKKVSDQPIDLGVIREIDLNKLEPWDLKEKCRIGSGPQNEWYFFSHKGKKYPTGTRTNRATAAGFWKATGRDKAIRLSSLRRIGMRKTLVFYTGRAPRGSKTDWIMHEYRLDDDLNVQVQEDGWVVCRVFKKKNYGRGGFHHQPDHHPAVTDSTISSKQIAPDHHQAYSMSYGFDQSDSMNLPQLMSPPESTIPSFLSSLPLNTMDMQFTQNLLSLGAGGCGGGMGPCSGSRIGQQEKFSSDWWLLDKLLATHHETVDDGDPLFSEQVSDLVPSSAHRFPFPSQSF